MSIFNFFRAAPRASAVQAKERLQIVMAHERAGRSGPDYLPMLQQELLAVIAKYVNIDENKVEVKLDRGGDCSTLEVNIELPAREQAKAASAAKPAADKPGNDHAAAKRSVGGSVGNAGAKKRI
ncbi:cell division topological specificity factor MinE [Azospirillum picis]|uniref:Cell division topological specificity factor n=1 Tax=Azospirillum picis TaxID=488438 RepID=A0ABU0MF08_9PROT|nr:cell division topological specificity factor MinE [Azospirillum picis]MBP2298184.1 cell division topological specificity factor [Azospirillum picis]MDQ0532022.1 cell division topological specificity factor [Azospirillum picis]